MRCQSFSPEISPQNAKNNFFYEVVLLAYCGATFRRPIYTSICIAAGLCGCKLYAYTTHTWTLWCTPNLTPDACETSLMHLEQSWMRSMCEQLTTAQASRHVHRWSPILNFNNKLFCAKYMCFNQIRHTHAAFTTEWHQFFIFCFVSIDEKSIKSILCVRAYKCVY